MTRNDIVEIAAEYADRSTVGRMKLVMDKFKTVSDFLAADDGSLMGAYNAARPQAPVLLPEPSRFYSLAQLKAVVSFMELCGIQQIDIDAMEQFCRAMKVDIYAAIGGLNA